MVVRFLIASEWLQYSEAPTWIHVQEAFFSVLFVADWVSRVVAFGGVRAVTRWGCFLRVSRNECPSAFILFLLLLLSPIH